MNGTSCSASRFLQLEPYTPPPWARGLKIQPAERYRLGMLPTPLHRWRLPEGWLPRGTELWVKRDDMSGCSMSGNKVRKLEFLLAEAMARGADSVVTIGGIQSNHARATAVAARYLGLEPHLVLRNSRAGADRDPGLEGNLLVERLVGATVHQVTKEEYAKHGADALGGAVVRRLQQQGRRPYYIPVGGSNALGCWGYLQAVQEIQEQSAAMGVAFDAVASACGSSATAAGLALGVRLSGLGAAAHALAVCDDAAYFYADVARLAAELGHGDGSPDGAGGRGLLTVHMAKGAGYAISQRDELETVLQAALAGGVLLDPVYSGKALHALLQVMREAPEEWAGKRVLFVHTGGLLGMYDGDKLAQMQPLVEALGLHERLSCEGLPARAAS